MLEFLQSYGVWIYFGLLFSLILWGYASRHGVGCGHRVYQQDPKAVKEEEEEEQQG
jgi:hypothetical protein